MPARSAVLLCVLLAVTSTATLGCSSNSSSTSAGSSSSVAAVTAPTTGPNTSGTDGSARSMHTDSSQVLRFDAPGSIACSGTATVTVTYETVDLTSVAFLVDTATTGVQAPNRGTSDVSLPCDGGVHTIMLIGTGPAGPAFASRAVVTQPA